MKCSNTYIRKYIRGSPIIKIIILSLSIICTVMLYKPAAAMSQAYRFSYGATCWLSNSYSVYDWQNGAYQRNWNNTDIKRFDNRYDRFGNQISWGNMSVWDETWAYTIHHNCYERWLATIDQGSAASGANYEDGDGIGGYPGVYYIPNGFVDPYSGLVNHYGKQVYIQYYVCIPMLNILSNGQNDTSISCSDGNKFYRDGSGRYWVQPNTECTVNECGYDTSGMSLNYFRIAGSGVDYRCYENWSGADGIFQKDGSASIDTISHGNVGNGYYNSSYNFKLTADNLNTTLQSFFLNTSNEYSLRTNEKNITYFYNYQSNGQNWNDNFTLCSDGTAPSGDNVRCTDTDANGFWVYVDDVADSRSGVKSVSVAAWTENNGQDDVKWYSMSNCWGNTYRAYVPISDHNYEKGRYRCDVYTYDNVNNYAYRGTAYATPGQPNLKFDWFGVIDDSGNQQTTLNVGQHYRIRTHMINDGNVSTGANSGIYGLWDATHNWTGLKWETAPALDSGGGWWEDTNFTPTESQLGSINFSASADNQNNIAESNESDNWASITVNVVDNPDASITDDLPYTLTSGQTYTVHITAKNTGTRPWVGNSSFNMRGCADNGYQDGNNPFNISANVKTTTNPGESTTFICTFTAPSPGIYRQSFKMVQDGVCWFGNNDIKTVIVLSARIEHANTEGYDIIIDTGSNSDGTCGVRCPTWTDYNGQDDLVQPWSSRNETVASYVGNGIYKYHVSRTAHNSEFGTYITDVYAWPTSNVDWSRGNCGPRLKIDLEKPIANFEISPNPQLSECTLNYTLNNSASVNGLSLGQNQWSFSIDNNTWSNVSSSPPNSFSVDNTTTFYIKERAATNATGNFNNQYGTTVQYDQMYSDWCVKSVKIINVGIGGFVGHTDDWNKKRLDYNSHNPSYPRPDNMFWPGEKFELTANTSPDLPVTSVSAAIEGTEFSTDLNSIGNNKWSGELWDSEMLSWPDENINFIFTAWYDFNGTTVIRQCTVPVIINNSNGGYWMQHREF